MARNAEKAMTTLSRWRAAQLAESGNDKNERRPYLASECHDLKKALKFRFQIIREVSKKVSQIQNAGLGEYRIRDLNDEINKLLREKRHWEIRIRDLGGPDLVRSGPRMLDAEGREVPGNRGYKYFGAAKDLPGVRELFEREPPPMPKKSRAELMKDVDADYYGYRDDDDGILIKLEMEAEIKAIEEAKKEWQSNQGKLKTKSKEVVNIYQSDLEDDEGQKKKKVTTYIAHVPVPTQKEIEEALIQRKKQQLLEKYASEELVQQTNEAKTLLGK
ncbi:NineTeen Complex (NTC) component [Chamberlinius hualienensis]